MTTEPPRWVLSGGLASGKSKVREFLERLGVLTIDADSIGHSVLLPEGPAYLAVVERWPHVVREGEIHRQSLAAIVFNDPAELAVLERITHPHIFDRIKARVREVESAVVVEVPLLSHGLGDDWRRMVVDCHEDARLRRAIGRGMSEADAASRFAAQPSRQEWLSNADLVIPNHGPIEELQRTVRLVTQSGEFNPRRE